MTPTEAPNAARKMHAYTNAETNEAIEAGMAALSELVASLSTIAALVDEFVKETAAEQLTDGEAT